MYKKTMREALREARAYRDPVNEDKGFSSQQIKMAYGVLNDPRYKQGNYSGAFKAIEKIAKGLASHPDVANALKRANEELEEKMKLKYDKDKEGFYDEKGRRRYLSIGATNAIMRKKLDHAIKTGDWTDFNKEELEEEFKVKFIDPANKKKFHITYRSKGEAEAKMAQLKNDGVKEIEIVQEELEEAMNISTAKKEIQKIYDKAKKDGNLGGKGHDDFKDLLKQTDTKKLYPKMHKLGTFLASVRRAFGQKLDPSSAKAQALGNELIKLSYKVNEELEEELTPAQKKLPVGLQKAIAAKGDKKDEMMTAEMMKKEMMKKMEMLKAETDPSKVEMMKKEMMTAMKEMGDMPEMMKKEMMKKMQEYGSMNAMKEAVSPAQQAAIAISKKEKEEKHTPSHKETAVNAMAMNAMKKETAKKEMMKMNAMKMPIQSMYGKMNAMKTGDDDLTPMNNMKLNAMIKDPHKSKGDDPKKDMNATYMKSDVRGDVKNGGGTDMSKVNDNPKPMAAMKKINAMYKTEKYLDEKPGSIQNVVAEMYQTGKLKG